MATSLERGWAKARLILELAQAEKSQVDLAAAYGVTQAAISKFQKRHTAEIAERQRDLADEWAGLWIADKRNRIAEYQDDTEAITKALEDTVDEKLLRAKLAIMRQVAEELGQLREIVQLDGTLTYRVEGIDPQVLR